MVLTTSASKAGNFYNGARLEQLNTTNPVIAMGDVIGADTAATNGFKTAPTSFVGRVAVAVEAKALNKTEVRAVVDGPVDVITSTNLDPGVRVKVSTTVAGQVALYTPAGTVADIGTPIGVFIGFGGAQNNNEREGGPRTGATAGQVVTIDLGRLT